MVQERDRAAFFEIKHDRIAVAVASNHAISLSNGWVTDTVNRRNARERLLGLVSKIEKWGRTSRQADIHQPVRLFTRQTEWMDNILGKRHDSIIAKRCSKIIGGNQMNTTLLANRELPQIPHILRLVEIPHLRQQLVLQFV